MTSPDSHWTFLTNHARALLGIAADPDVRLRDLAEGIGVTERAAQRIVADLVADGYVERARVGRRNHYRIHPEVRLRHPADRRLEIGSLIALFEDDPGPVR
ncbi:MAG: winged helix-turn-helix domain-containing protein [Actinobacteria bacterium]|nr:winged helix-turn-helix domain-containing protein [Actinomycetota bacterium]